MFTINGSMTSAKIMIDDVEKTAISQIYEMCNHPASQNPIAIMPDTHAGSGCVIGFTMKCGNRIVPDWIGVDIGCGMYAMNHGKIENLNFENIDNYIEKNIPMGKNVHSNSIVKMDCEYLYNKVGVDVGYANRSIGTLGGGNHFIEIGKDENDNIWSIVHSGSRNFGLKVCQYHQKIAKENNGYLENELADNYIVDMKIAQKYASLNRKTMANIIVELLGNPIGEIETTHNYIDDNNMIRKGAVSANNNEVFILPFNMRDGTLICIGKGNEDWNFSAPHGAGRIMSRGDAKRNIELSDFQNSMKGIYSTTITSAQIDEAPMAYKDANTIENLISPTANIRNRIKPIYNRKA